MVYNLDIPFQRNQFLSRAEYLSRKGGTVELTSKKPKSTNQNSYVHSIISYFALQYGETAEYCKHEYFKKSANPEIFWVERENDIRGRYKTLRSTATLSQEEMSLAIERFKNWASKTAGIYLPEPDDFEAMRQIDIEIQRNKQYL